MFQGVYTREWNSINNIYIWECKCSKECILENGTVLIIYMGVEVFHGVYTREWNSINNIYGSVSVPRSVY